MGKGTLTACKSVIAAILYSVYNYDYQILQRKRHRAKLENVLSPNLTFKFMLIKPRSGG